MIMKALVEPGASSRRYYRVDDQWWLAQCCHQSSSKSGSRTGLCRCLRICQYSVDNRRQPYFASIDWLG